MFSWRNVYPMITGCGLLELLQASENHVIDSLNKEEIDLRDVTHHITLNYDNNNVYKSFDGDQPESIAMDMFKLIAKAKHASKAMLKAGVFTLTIKSLEEKAKKGVTTARVRTSLGIVPFSNNFITCINASGTTYNGSVKGMSNHRLKF